MEKISLPQSSQYTSPNSATLICSQKPDGTTNIATVAWWTILSYNPEFIVFVMMNKSFTGEMIRKNKKVIVTIPGAELSQIVFKCGTTSGRDTDKVKEFNIELQDIGDSPI